MAVKRMLDRWTDLVVAAWITLFLVQHLALVSGALLGPEALADRPDFRVGYWVLGTLILGSAGLQRIRGGEHR